MYKFLRFYVMAILLSLLSAVRAERLDSIGRIIVPTALQQDMYARKTASPLGIALLPRGNFGFSYLEYSHESGRLMCVQMPEGYERIHLRSLGLYSANRWQLYGEFAYSRNYSDSVQWLLSEPPRDGMPYYFGSPKKGNWEIETYDIKGTLSLDVSKLFTAGASVSIRYFKGTRSNDPRPSATSFLSRYELFGGLRLPHFSALVGGGLGYGTRDNDILYTNPDNDRVLRLDMMSYELMGFGMNRKTQAYHNRTIESNINSYHAGAQMQWRHDSLTLWARFDYAHQKDIIRRSRTVNVSLSTLSYYYTDKSTLDAGLSYAFSPRYTLDVQGFACLTKGHDHLLNVLQGQKNYVYNNKQGGLNALFDVHSNGRRVDRYGLSLGYTIETRKEGSSEHRYKQKLFEAGLSWTQQRALCSSYFIFYGLRQQLLLPTATLTYPAAQENIFTTDIAIPVSRYYSISQGSSAVHVGAGRNLGRLDLSLLLRYNIAYALGDHHGIGGNRRHFDAAIILSF